MRLLALILVLLPAVPSARALERDIVRQFPALPGCSLSVDTFRGSITINEADTSQIRVAIHLAIGSDDPHEADQLLQALQLDVSAEGPAVRVSARDPQQTGMRFTWNDDKQLEPTYRITVPRRCNVDVRTRKGVVIVGNIEGTVKGRSESGDVFFRHIRGSAEAFTVAGDIVISHCDGPILAEARLGTIRIGVVSGRCVVVNHSGDIDIEDAKSDVEMFAEAGTASVCFARDFRGKAEVRTSGGPIVAAVDPQAQCEIEASASFFAHVYARLPLKVLKGSPGTRHLDGVLNGGQNRIVLHASGGDVRLLGRAPVLEPSSDGP